MSDRVEIVRALGNEIAKGQPFGGQPVFEVPGAYVGVTRLGPGAVTPWHHHGACNFFGYVLEGTVTIQFGPRGELSEKVAAGHFLRIPPRLVHRDLNETEASARIATMCVGEGPMSTAVAGPDA